MAVAVYVSEAQRRGVLPAEVGPRGRRTIHFDPVRVVLRAISPRALLRRGGAALAALPLVGTDRQVLASARAWQRRLRSTATLDEEERADALRLFLLLLADRFDVAPTAEVKTSGSSASLTTGAVGAGRGTRRRSSPAGSSGRAEWSASEPVRRRPLSGFRGAAGMVELGDPAGDPATRTLDPG